jgi:hypothetical protein
MVGYVVILYHAPESLFVFFEWARASWLAQFVFLGSWLGIGLVFAVAGLTSKSAAGQMSAVFAVLVFLAFAYFMLASAYLAPDYVKWERPTRRSSEWLARHAVGEFGSHVRASHRSPLRSAT